MRRGTVENVLDMIGMPHTYIGYEYIVEESLLMFELFHHHKKIILNDLNNCIANMFNASLYTIERNIRTCIEGTFLHGNMNGIDKLFDYYKSFYDSRPSNKLFLTTIVNYLNKVK